MLQTRNIQDIDLRDQSIIRGWGGGGADRGWVSKFHARIKGGGGGGATKIYVGVMTIFLKTLLKYHQINDQYYLN